MWISRKEIETLRIENAKLREEIRAVQLQAHERAIGFERENARLRSDQDWFKLRLNQVEQERAMLMADRIGVRVNVPQFLVQPEGQEGQALHELPDLSTVGGDAKDEPPVPTSADPGEGVDFTMMPGYTGDRK